MTDLDKLGTTVLTTSVFTLLGLVMFAIAFFVIDLLTPFKLIEEIQQKNNTALAILIGAVILGIAHIVGSAIHG